MKWEYIVKVVDRYKLKSGVEEANKMGALGWELMSVTETIGLGRTSSAEPFSETKEYNFFFKRPLKVVTLV